MAKASTVLEIKPEKQSSDVYEKLQPKTDSTEYELIYHNAYNHIAVHNKRIASYANIY